MIKSWLSAATKKLQQAGVTSARLDAELLLGHTLDVDRTWLHAHATDELQGQSLKKLDELMKRRLKREPIAYIIGHKEFYGRDFIVTPDVLIPRPESEVIIELLKELPLVTGTYAIDVGAGSGCLGLTAMLECPRIRDMVLSDISERALAVAKQNNRARYHLTKVLYCISDLLERWDSEPGTPYIGLILANLPYVDRSWQRSPETDFEPSLALFADDGGLALISTLIEQAGRVLTHGGWLLLEADPEQHERIISHGQQNGLRVETVRDYIIVLQKQ